MSAYEFNMRLNRRLEVLAREIAKGPELKPGFTLHNGKLGYKTPVLEKVTATSVPRRERTELPPIEYEAAAVDVASYTDRLKKVSDKGNSLHDKTARNRPFPVVPHRDLSAGTVGTLGKISDLPIYNKCFDESVYDYDQAVNRIHRPSLKKEPVVFIIGSGGGCESRTDRNVKRKDFNKADSLDDCK